MENNVDKVGKKVSIKKLPGNYQTNKIDAREILAEVCYYYPQYTLKEAGRLSYRDVQLLLRTARKQQAIYYYNMTQIAAAPHTKKGEGVSNLSEHFNKLANS